MMRSLDEINRDLAFVADALLALDGDAFAERYVLLKRQDELRAEADGYQTDFDEQRPIQDILSELQTLRKQRDTELGRQTGRVMMSGPGGTGGAAGAVSGEMMRLSAKANASGPMTQLNMRIAALESMLRSRGIEPASGRVSDPSTQEGPEPASA